MKIFNEHSDHVSLDSIKRYLNDQMSQEERHFFERHLLDCAFCYEAFEGYQLSPDSVSDDAQERLKSLIKNRVVVKKTPRLAIAAAVIFLLSFSIVLTFSVWKNKKDEISMVKKTEEEIPKELIVPPEEPKQTEEVEKTIQKPEPESKEFIEEGARKKKLAIEQKTKSVPQKSESPTIDSARDEIVESAPDSFAAIEEEPESLEEATVEQEITVDIPAEPEATDLTNAITTKKEALKSRSRAPSPGVARSTVQELSSKKELEEDSELYQNAQPIGGFEKYRRYLKDSLRYPENAKSNTIEGEVRLQFLVSKDGDIENLEITKSLSAACDLEAKRLVLEGERWLLIDKTVPEENNVVKLTIEFNLSD